MMMMPNPFESRMPLTTSLEADILLLSTFLSGQHASSPRAHPEDEHLSLLAGISTLLTAVYDREPEAHNTTAIISKAAANVIDFVICAEHSSTDRALLDPVKELDSRRGPTGDVQISNQDDCSSAGEAGDLIPITPVKEDGRKLLDVWDLESPDDDGVKLNLCVMHGLIDRALIKYL